MPEETVVVIVPAGKAAVEIAASTYLGKTCRWCHKPFDTSDDLKDAVLAGSRGRIAHKVCFAQHQHEVAPEDR